MMALLDFFLIVKISTNDNFFAALVKLLLRYIDNNQSIHTNMTQIDNIYISLKYKFLTQIWFGEFN